MAEDRDELHVVTLPTTRIEFPDGFAWGAAACAHQTEGGNWNSDWWEWEHRPNTPCVEVSGDAIDHYNRYDADFELLSSLGHNAHRFGIEWARIEPEKDQFSNAALDHYARVIESLHRHNLTPFMTLHHFSSPRWFAAEGGWASSTAVDRFRRYAEVVAKRLQVPFVCTINEPQIVAQIGYQGTGFPPGAGENYLFGPVTRNFIASHAAAVEVFKEHQPDASIGLVLATADYQAANEESVKLRDRIHHRMVGVYHDALRTGVFTGFGEDEAIPNLKGTSDFVGVNYYTRTVIDTSKPGNARFPEPDAETTQMGYEVVPDCFVTVLKLAYEKTGLPVYVTENGIGTDDDKQRVRFIARHLAAVKQAMDEGADIRGYLYWCPMDNFEWTFGFARTFGLIAVDRQTFERTPKPSASYYAEICRSNAVDPDVTAGYL